MDRKRYKYPKNESGPSRKPENRKDLRAEFAGKRSGRNEDQQSDNHDSSLKSSLPLSEQRTVTSTNPGPQKIRELIFAVVSAHGAGKSTFVRHTFDLRSDHISSFNSKKMSLEGEIFLISLIEVQLDEIKIFGDHKIDWPTNTGNTDASRVDGVLALYDVTEPNSISRIPDLLSESLHSLRCSDFTRVL